MTAITLTGTVTMLDVQTDGGDGAIAIAIVDEDADGVPLPADQRGRAWLRLPSHAIEHLAARYSAFASTDVLYRTVNEFAAWLDTHNDVGDQEIATRIMKVGEEFGETVAAWIGMTGQNPRKGLTHTSDDVAGELADVVFAALVAISSLGHDAEAVMAARVARVARVAARLGMGSGRTCAHPGDHEHDHDTCIDANEEQSLAAEGQVP